MAIRDKLRANAQAHLEPGEQIQAVFTCQSHSAWLMVATGVVPFVIFNTYMPVAVTDRRILVGDSGSFVTTKFNKIMAVLPRETQIGPATGLWYKTEALGRRTYIHKRFHNDVNEADRLIGAGGAPGSPGAPGPLAAPAGAELPPPPT